MTNLEVLLNVIPDYVDVGRGFSQAHIVTAEELKNLLRDLAQLPHEEWNHEKR